VRGGEKEVCGSKPEAGLDGKIKQSKGSRT